MAFAEPTSRYTTSAKRTLVACSVVWALAVLGWLILLAIEWYSTGPSACALDPSSSAYDTAQWSWVPPRRVCTWSLPSATHTEGAPLARVGMAVLFALWGLAPEGHRPIPDQQRRFHVVQRTPNGNTDLGQPPRHLQFLPRRPLLTGPGDPSDDPARQPVQDVLALPDQLGRGMVKTNVLAGVPKDIGGADAHTVATAESIRPRSSTTSPKF